MMMPTQRLLGPTIIRYDTIAEFNVDSKAEYDNDNEECGNGTMGSR